MGLQLALQNFGETQILIPTMTPGIVATYRLCCIYFLYQADQLCPKDGVTGQLVAKHVRHSFAKGRVHEYLRVDLAG
jgi:hypothetical protein